MPRKRKGLSKKVRFEVFKRDSFTCQYCGASAPNTILRIDHINPVAKGGTDDILNLITSCFDCNSGKSDIELDDDSVIVKQHRQLGLLQQRREQIEQIFQWRKELDKIQENTTSMIADYIKSKVSDFSINEQELRDLDKLSKKYNLADILEAVDKSASNYLQHYADGSITKKSADEFFGKIPGILFNESRTPLERKMAYVKGICKNRFSYWNPRTGSIALNNYVKALKIIGYTENRIIADLEDKLIPKTKTAKNLSEWRDLIQGWTDELKVGEKQNAVEDEDEIDQSDLDNTVANLLEIRANITPALEHIGKAFPNFTSDSLINKLDRMILDHLFELQEHFETHKSDKLSSPSYHRAFKASGLAGLFKPIENVTTYYLEFALDGLMECIINEVSYFIDHDPDPEHFRYIAEKYHEGLSFNY